MTPDPDPAEPTSTSEPATNRERVRVFTRDHPDAGIQQIAQALGLNTGTVHRLRKGLKNHSDDAKPSGGEDSSDPAAVRAAIGAQVARATTHLTADKVTEEALAAREWDIDAGEWLRHFWRGRGLHSLFETPRHLVEEAVTWWWANKDHVDRLERVMLGQQAEIARLRVQLAPITQRRQTWETVLQAQLVAAIAGHPLPDDSTLTILRGAKELGLA
ncbi:MAG: helix-turn-helix domain-containing protein [Thermoplasmata archaeon]